MYGVFSGDSLNPALFSGAEVFGPAAKLRHLSAWQWRVLLSTPLVLLLTWVRLRTRGYGGTLAAAQPEQSAPLVAGEQVALAREASYAMAAAIKYGPWRPKCLLRSLALGWYLGRRGLSFGVRLGVPNAESGSSAPASPEFSAHAWVEVGGTVVNDGEDVHDRYLPFADG